MYVCFDQRFNPSTGEDDRYFKIKESFRDSLGKVHNRVMLTPGFIPDLSPVEAKRIGDGLTLLMKRSVYNESEQELFKMDPLDAYTPKERKYIQLFWDQMVARGSIDRNKISYDQSVSKGRRFIDMDTVHHTDAREVGAEWIVLQAIRELQIDKVLKSQGWDEKKVKNTLATLIGRTVYPGSELSILNKLQDNSAAMELLTGIPEDCPGKNDVYASAPALLEIKDALDTHLSHRTDNLFDLTSTVILYDLTNFTFEGSKEGSQLAKFGKPKNKRTDCKQVVLAMGINPQGFLKYAAILPGNTADPKSLPDMVDAIVADNPPKADAAERTLVMIDAGIATEDNLKLLVQKGYDYICVSRTKLKEYKLVQKEVKVTVKDNVGRDITLELVEHEEGSDYYMKVTSPAKAYTQESMNKRNKQLFEDGMLSIRSSLTKKGGIKMYEAVVRRVGRMVERYPSIAKFYDVKYVRSTTKPKNMGDVIWTEKKSLEEVEQTFGTYFIRTNRSNLDEVTTWNYYNLIRDIEESNRQVKTDLKLNPLYHQKDDTTEAHLYFGLISYWIVNTIRYKLKINDDYDEVNHYWTEIVRIMSTQKAITTEGVNALGEIVQIRACSDPKPMVEKIYKALDYSDIPIRKHLIIPNSK